MSTRCAPCAVPADDVLKAGWLTKRAVSAWRPFKNWRSRYLVLTADTLSWHETEDTSKRRGSLPICQDTTVRMDGLNLLIETKGRKLMLTATEAVLSAWQRAVNFVVNHAEEEGVGIAPRSARASSTVSRKSSSSIGDTPRCVECGPDEPAPDVCGICLSAIGDEEQGEAPIKLRRCSHSFCSPCLAKHIETQRKAGRAAWCPICRRPVDIFDVLRVCDRESCGLGEGGEAEAVRAPETAEQRRERERSARQAQRDFEAIAARLHMRKCPHCAVPIIKNGGCNNMTCRGGCGRSFAWNRAPTVVPCRQVHLRSTGVKLWCEVCPGAHPIAYVKLAGARTLFLVFGGPAVVTFLALGAGFVAGVGGLALVVSSAPLALFGPLALLYSPMHAAAERRREAEIGRKNAATLAAWRKGCAKVRWGHLRTLGATGLVRAMRNADAADAAAAAPLVGRAQSADSKPSKPSQADPDSGVGLWGPGTKKGRTGGASTRKGVPAAAAAAPPNLWYAINSVPAYYYSTRTKHVQWHRPSVPGVSVKWVGPDAHCLLGGAVFGDEGVPAPPRAQIGNPGLRKGEALPRKPMLSRYSRKASKLETAAFSGGATVGRILGHWFDDD